MKAVLVIDDMPKNCHECPLLGVDEEDMFYCTPLDLYVEDTYECKSHRCPLMELKGVWE